MNSSLKVARRKNPPVVEIAGQESVKQFTRIWMAVVPPLEDEPAYACVLGEVFDGDTRQKSRQKILLDEAVCLTPDDLSRAGVRPERYEDLVYVPSRGEDGEAVTRRPKSELVTMEDIRPAAVALKDIYGHDAGHEDNPLYLWTLPGPVNEPFFHWLRITHGLTFYSGNYDEHQLRVQFPFYHSRGRVVPVMNEVPFYRDNEAGDYALRLIEALVARDELLAVPGMDRFATKTLKNPVRAVGLLCAAMQLMDWSFHVQDWEQQDGYADADPENNEAEAERLREEQEFRLWQAGVD